MTYGRAATIPRESGEIRIYEPANPAVGANINLAVPSGEIWHVLSVKYRLVSSATAANRVPGLELWNANLTWRTIVLNANWQTATRTVDYEFYSDGDAEVARDNNGVYNTLIAAPLADTFIVGSIRTNITNLQANDQISAIVVEIEVFKA